MTTHPRGRSLKILQLAQKPQRRGAEIFAVQLGCWLAGAGHMVRHAYLYRYRGQEPLEDAGENLCLDREENTRSERLPFGNPSLLGALLRAIRRYDPDIVQANGGRSVKYAALTALLSPGRRWKLVYRNIDSPVFWVRGQARRAYFKHLIMPRVDGVVGVSRKTLAEVYDFYGLSVPGVFVPNGIDLTPLQQPAERSSVRASLGITEPQVAVLFFGALTAQKRPERFVRLVRRLRDAGEDVVGWVLGDGEAREPMERLAAELGIGTSLRFLGYRPRVADIVTASDLLASTSDSEGIPAAVLEAGYLEVPTVGFDVGGMSECVLDGETGLLAPAGDEEELFRLALELVRDPPRRRSMGRAARAFVAESSSMDAVGRRYERFYQELLAGEASRPET